MLRKATAGKKRLITRRRSYISYNYDAKPDLTPLSDPFVTTVNSAGDITGIHLWQLRFFDRVADRRLSG